MNKNSAETIIKIAFGREIYIDSLKQVDDVWLAITKPLQGNKQLVCLQEQACDWFELLEAQSEKVIEGTLCKLCDLTSRNAAVIRKYIPWAAPSPAGSQNTLLGTGDRLGIATPAHIIVAKKTKVRVALAQANPRMCSISSMSYAQILDNATWGVLQSGWQGGWSANAEQLTDGVDISAVLNMGYTGIGLDCSDSLQEIDIFGDQPLHNIYQGLPISWRQELEQCYLDKVFEIQEYGTVRLPLCASGGNLRYKAGKFKISYSLEQLQALAVNYAKVIERIVDVYNEHLAHLLTPIDFVPTLSSNSIVTSAQAHLFLVSELSRRGVNITGLGLRFVGEFPVGIDYTGDKWGFEQTFSIHASIAEHFGHRLDFPYSDKYSLYPFIGRDTRGRVAIKTEGTSWLEALHTIWKVDPKLFRKILIFADNNLYEIQQRDPLAAIGTLTDFGDYSDKELEKLLVCNDDWRRILHLAYTLLMKDRKLKQAIYESLQANEELYYKVVAENLKKHIEYLRTIKRSLGLPKNRFFRSE